MDNMKLHFDVDGEDFTRAGEASGETKRVLKGLGFDANVIRNVVYTAHCLSARVCGSREDFLHEHVFPFGTAR